MTLEKEAEKYVTENTGFSSKQPLGKIAVRIFLAGAEPREKRIAELKADNDARKFAMAMSEKVEKQLREENAELKNRDCWKSCEYANPKSELIAQHIKDVQNLTKAKKIIQKLTDFANSKIEYNPEHPEEYTKSWNELCKQAEDFIKE